MGEKERASELPVQHKGLQFDSQEKWHAINLC